MTKHSDKTELCRYHYDPLDRQCGCTIVLQPAHQRFHCKSRLVTEIQGAARWSLFQHDDQLLAQRNHVGANATTLLLASDQQRSVLNALDAARLHPLAYSPYGHRAAQSGLLSLLGFNGERADPVTGHYHLGNGYRQFNPLLMRFNSPDGWSPFGEGGLNAYGYCEGDPVNRSDPTGHRSNVVMRLLKGIANKFGRTPSKLRPAKVKNPVSANKVPADLTPSAQDYSAPQQPQPSAFDNLISQAKLDRQKYRDIKSTQKQKRMTPSKHEVRDFGSSKQTRNHLLNRRTHSLESIPDSKLSQEDITAFLASKNYEADGGFLVSWFASSPTSPHARLYLAMESELSALPNRTIQRIIRTGGHR